MKKISTSAYQHISTLVFCLIASLLFSSCGTLQKTANKVFHKESHAKDSGAVIKKVTTGTTTTTTKTDIDTTIRTNADTTKATIPLEQLLNGDTLSSDDGKTEVQVFINPKTKRVTGKAISKPVETHLQAHQTVTQTQATQTKEQDKILVKTTDKTQTNSKTTTIHKYVSLIPWYAWVILALIILFLIARFIFKRSIRF